MFMMEYRHLWYLARMNVLKYTKSLKNKHNPPWELIKVTAAKFQIFAFNTFKTSISARNVQTTHICLF